MGDAGGQLPYGGQPLVLSQSLLHLFALGDVLNGADDQIAFAVIFGYGVNIQQRPIGRPPDTELNVVGLTAFNQPL